MIYPELTTWIADSESWQSHMDYQVSDNNVQGREFLSRSSDFYISLLSQLQDVLENFYTEETEDTKKDLMSIAKGLEIYSLKSKKEAFEGVNYRRNMLYVASLYYLADFSATGILLLKQFSDADFDGQLEKFLYYFLSRSSNRLQATENGYFSNVFNFLRGGNPNQLLELSDKFENILNSGKTESRHFVLAYFSKCVIKKFTNNNIWSDLQPYGTDEEWRPYIRFNISKYSPVWSFFPSQRSGISAGLLTFERAFSLQTPTSSGKTAISELVIYNELRKNPLIKILYLAPFRALASELRNNLGRNLSAKLGINVKTIYGGSVVTDFDKISISESTVLISTPEKFMAIEVSEPGILDDFDLVICDEGHLIDSQSRGISYELLLSRLKRSEDHRKRFLFLSAIVPNIAQINLWLGGQQQDVAVSNYRPTEIELAFLKQTSAREFDLQVNPNQNAPKNYNVNGFLTRKDFVGGGEILTPTTFKAKAVSAALKSLNSGAVAIFSPTKDVNQGVAGIAEEIIRQAAFNLPDPRRYVDLSAQLELLEYFNILFGTNYLLTRSIQHGFLFHHGDLPQFIRELIEEYVRDEKIKLLICTTTLSEGVNLPIKTLVVKTAKRFNGSISEPLPYRDLKNLIGRAGRAGKETKGTIIIITPGEFNIFLNVINNVGLEPANGFLAHVVRVIDRYIVRQRSPLTNELLDLLEQSDIIDNAIINLLAEDIDVAQLQSEISTLTKNTFTYFQSSPQHRLMLEKIFELRLERIRDAIRTNKIESIRRTGIPLRIYDDYTANISFDDAFLEIVSHPLEDVWMDFIINAIYNVNGVKKFLADNYTRNQLTQVIKAWIGGKWYLEIANILSSNVSEAIEFMKFLEYQFQVNVNSIIRYIEEKREAADLETSYIVSQWTNYLMNGVENAMQLALIELGLSDRLVVWALEEWLRSNNFSSDDPDVVKAILIDNGADSIQPLSENLPAISQRNLSMFISKIRFQ